MIPPDVLALLSEALDRQSRAGQIRLTLCCDPSGKPAAMILEAQGQERRAILRSPVASPGRAAGKVSPILRPEPCASLLRATADYGLLDSDGCTRSTIDIDEPGCLPWTY